MEERQILEQQGPVRNPAETYESYMVPTIFKPWATHLIQVANPRTGERVLDVGCGTGIVARCVAPRVGPTGRVVGLDLTPNMLAVAQDVAVPEGLSIEWHEGRAEQLPFPDRSFDLVASQAAFMFFTNRLAVLAEMRRVLSDGGRVCISVPQGLDRHPFYQKLDDAIRWHLGTSSVQEIFVFADGNELLTLLTDAGFQRIEIVSVSVTSRLPDPEKFLAGEIDVDTAAIPSMQHLNAQARQRLVAAIRQEMEAPLREVTQGNEVVLPFYLHIARAERGAR